MTDLPPIPLIGLAHGSRHPEANSSISQLMAAVRRVGGMPTAAAFLDLTEPDLATVAGRLAAAGHRSAVVAPLLFTEAFHATVDVPAAVCAASEASGLELETADILGTDDDMLDVVRESMARAHIGDTESVLLLSVGSSSSLANDAIVDLAHRLAQRRVGTVAAAFATRAPRATEVLAALTPPVAIVPLFLSPGLLLDPLAAFAAQRGMTMAPPLGELVVPLLLKRYRRALAQVATSWVETRDTAQTR